jgi:hypothetical protein
MRRKTASTAIVPVEVVQQRIVMLRGQRVITDVDLARLYGVTTKRLNQQISRNADRFPADFMFQLTTAEVDRLRSQIATSKTRGGRRYLPYAFTEHGAIMAATVLNSPQAVKASLFVVRAFVKLRELLSTHHELAAKLDELERRLQNHDDQILALVDAIRQLMEDPEDSPKPPIGFATELNAPLKPNGNLGIRDASQNGRKHRQERRK